MALYYVRKSGSDANAGTSPGAAWLTIGKALGAGGIASGDTVYVGAGTYREVVTVSMTSATAETQVIADVDGSKTGDAGPIIWTAYTTNDKTAPSGSALLNLSGRDFLTFDGFYLVGGTNNTGMVLATTTNSVNITFRRCLFNTLNTDTMDITGLADVAQNWLIEQCIFLGGAFQSAIYVVSPTSASADYDINFVVRNCLFLTGVHIATIQFDSSGAGAFKPGGGVVQNCQFHSQSNSQIRTGTANRATSIPLQVKNCWLNGIGGTGLNANTSGQISEDYNLIQQGTARTNVSAGANSIATTNYSKLIDAGYSELVGLIRKPFHSPVRGSPLLGFGNDSTPAALTTDIHGRPKPAGGDSTALGIGHLERHDTAVNETSVVDAGSTACKIVGPGDHDLLIPVDASATVITVRVRYDTNHGTTNKPQAALLANGEIGVTAETKTATVGTDTWETLTFSSFTPTARGYVKVRLVSRSAAGNGIAYFDTLTGGAGSSAGFDYFTRSELPSGMVAGGSSGGPVGHGRLTGGLQ